MTDATATQVVWVTIGSNKGYRVRYHYKQSCWLHRDKVGDTVGMTARIPTMESYAQLAGLTPCRSCVPHGPTPGGPHGA